MCLLPEGLTELTRRMAYRVRGLDPMTGPQRRRIEIDRYAKLYRYGEMARPASRARRKTELMIAKLWVSRHPEACRIALPEGQA